MRYLFRSLALVAVVVFISACGGGGGGGSSTGTTSGTRIPSSPQGVGASAGDTVNTLSWSDSNGATTYNLYWSTSSGAGLSGNKIPGVSSGYVHNSLNNGTTYYYVVTAENAAGESAPSSEISGTPSVPAPDAPVIASVSPADGSVSLSWNPVADATSYNLYWSTSSGEGTSGMLLGDVSSPYQHTGLTNGTTYYYVLTAVGSGGESAPSNEVSSTPFVPPYATAAYPYHLGDAPLAGHQETLPGDTRDFHYTIGMQPGEVYLLELDKVVDGARIEFFSEEGWNSDYRMCLDFRDQTSKGKLQCVVEGPSSGLAYVRIGGTTSYTEEATLTVESITTEGTKASPVLLAPAPIGPERGTVLEEEQSIYRVPVTPGEFYRVSLNDWVDSGASTSQLYLQVYDGDYTSYPTGLLCEDVGSNGGSNHETWGPVIHCLAAPQNSHITIVTEESMYGTGAAYDIRVEEAITDGTSASPLLLSGSALVYQGEISDADQDSLSQAYGYYQLELTPNTDYMIDLRGMIVELDMSVMGDASFTTSQCNSSEFNLIDESCVVNSGATGQLYVLVKGDADINARYWLSAIADPGAAVTAPVRYPGEGTEITPLDLGSVPVTARLSTVNDGKSYFSLSVTQGATLGAALTELNGDVDVAVFSDITYTDRLCASRAPGMASEQCDFTVPPGISTVYVVVDGSFATNNGSWSNGTEETVGAMYRLGINPQ